MSYESLKWELKKTLWLMTKLEKKEVVKKDIEKILNKNNEKPVVFIVESMQREDLSTHMTEGKMLAAQFNNIKFFSYYYLNPSLT